MENLTVFRARADVCWKQVFSCTKIAVQLYCHLDGIRSSWIDNIAQYKERA